MTIFLFSIFSNININGQIYKNISRSYGCFFGVENSIAAYYKTQRWNEYSQSSTTRWKLEIKFPIAAWWQFVRRGDWEYSRWNTLTHTKWMDGFFTRWWMLRKSLDTRCTRSIGTLRPTFVKRFSSEIMVV